jgi:hypothetical protein
MGLWEAQHPILVRILVRALAWSGRPNKSYYVRHHRRLSYKVGDWVWLRVRQRIPPPLFPATFDDKQGKPTLLWALSGDRSHQ